MSASNTTNTNTEEWADFTEWQGRLMAMVECGCPVGCPVWSKCTSDQGYGCRNVKWYYAETKVWKYVRRGNHRPALNLGTKQLTAHYHVSHLCDIKLWCSVEHLSLEPNWINAQRIKCLAEGTCPGQDEYKSCIFPYWGTVTLIYFRHVIYSTLPVHVGIALRCHKS